MYFNFVDIGTSDFGTSIKNKKIGQKVLLVEPLQFYLDALPDGEGITKANYAVSNQDSSIKIFYVTPENIENYKLPRGFKGCNSIGKEHKTVLAYLKSHSIPLDIIESQDVSVISFNSLISKYAIDSIGRLKVDTEGHDHIILRNVLDVIKGSNFKIKEIVFEYEPSFENTSELELLVKEFLEVGYEDLGFHKNNRVIQIKASDQ